MQHPPVDITIIGGGPTGLFGLFYAGMRGVTAQIVDALPQLGGQLTALYPEKYIFDVGGFPRVLAKDFVRALTEQALQFRAPAHLNETITGLERRDGQFVLQTEGASFPCKAIVIAAGIGAFSPRRLPQAVSHPWYGRGIFDVVTDPEQFRGKRILIIGGGDTAFDWAHQLLDRAATGSAPTRQLSPRFSGRRLRERWVSTSSMSCSTSFMWMTCSPESSSAIRRQRPPSRSRATSCSRCSAT